METGRGAEPAQLSAVLLELSREVAALRKLLLKHGHAQELFQGRVEERLAKFADDGRSDGTREPRPGAGSAPTRTELSKPQLRVLIEFDQAVRHLLALATETATETATAAPGLEPDAGEPRSLREALSFLQIRIQNLQRSFGLEPIPARGRPFDDRCHRVQGVCDRPDLPAGQVVEEVLPGYRLAGEVVRPALVIVNQPRPASAQAAPPSPSSSFSL